MIKLGSEVRDALTGLVGVAIARIEYLNGCVSYHLQPRLDKEGAFVESQWVDEQQLDPYGDADTGGPGAVPGKRSVPSRR